MQQHPRDFVLNEDGIENTIYDIANWHKDRNLIEGSDDKNQVLKLIQELGELSDSICKGKDPVDDIGDIMVILINIAVRNGYTLKQCLDHAYNDIKNRRGKMIDGIFVKETDNRDPDSIGNRL